MSEPYVLVFDIGTTNLKVFAFNKQREVLSSRSAEIPLILPKPSWVEQDANLISSRLIELAECLIEENLALNRIPVCIGITNQTESIVLWDKQSGKPVYNSINWQCQRTVDYLNKIKSKNLEREIRLKTGLPLKPAFSASKLRWVFDNVPGVFEQAEKGNILAGTLDTWLLWNLSDRKLHITDASNASRTMLFNIIADEWDKDLLRLFNIPRQILPEVHSSCEVYGQCNIFPSIQSIPICSLIGDQQSSLYGQCGIHPGDIKLTYGTGAFLYQNIGIIPKFSESGLITTIAWKKDNQIQYAFEGFIPIAGAVVQWLRDGLEIINEVSESEALATNSEENNELYFVPALSGLGAPYWDPGARGTIIGISRGTTKCQIVRAALEGICFQIRDVMDIMVKETGTKPNIIMADGGATANQFLMQFQADILGIEVKRFAMMEATARGAAILAGKAIDFYPDNEDSIPDTLYKSFYPNMPETEREQRYSTWHSAVERSSKWVK